MDQENSERTAEDKALNDRLDKEIRDREDACNQLQARYIIIIIIVISLNRNMFKCLFNSVFKPNSDFSY